VEMHLQEPRLRSHVLETVQAALTKLIDRNLRGS
jgi:hypothetical protein